MFKVTKTNSQIRKSSHLFWYRDIKTDYITNGYWAIKTDLQKGKYRKILSVLVEMFGIIPGIGEELRKVSGCKQDEFKQFSSKPYWLEILEEEPVEILTDTNLVHLEQRYKMKIFKGKDYVHINDNYMEMVDIKGRIIKGGGLKPIFIYDDNDFFMVLPMRMHDTNEHLKVLENKNDPSGLQSFEVGKEK